MEHNYNDALYSFALIPVAKKIGKSYRTSAMKTNKLPSMV
jgi:hypothetical protein